jgi:hypothetical protein
LVPAELLFRQIYAHRLNEIDGLELYTLGHLLRDDPVVLAHFRHYTITGELEIAFDEDPEAAMNHLLAIADAVTEGEEFSFVAGGDWAIYSDGATSTGLVGEPGGDEPPGEPPPQPFPPEPEVPQELRPFDRDLRDEVPASRLPNRLRPPGKRDLYWWDHKVPCAVQDPVKPGIEWCEAPGTIGFDCDDYALAMIAWLRHFRELYDAAFYQLHVFWGVDSGHALVLVLIGEYFYLIDPQTGFVLGPFDKSDYYANDYALLRQLLRQLINNLYKDDKDVLLTPEDNINIFIRDRDIPIPAEPPPWYTDPAMRDRFKDKMDIPDDAGLDPYIWLTAGGQ